ncbi:uncharacterized protein MCYG_07235 [Microsporum canis CBS 113480]|uniref:Uncharacterized protein n=1 Tax=Arthroderma otae (strain ATCC MYA-4605 / CBS 113480) TaxID=554155 RepID=C5FY18_ARTOC|nr:uncharacterized protein MCYG_07235 [Microsporum canis CBS 113480]EEQ34416.1 predicted protein [Microsporum canis CBS 113480]
MVLRHGGVKSQSFLDRPWRRGGELLAEFSDAIVVKDFENGPFVINHNDLTIQNVTFDMLTRSLTSLVFSTSLAAPLFPWLFITERDSYFRHYSDENVVFNISFEIYWLGSC